MATLEVTLAEVMTLISNNKPEDASKVLVRLLDDLPFEVSSFDPSKQRAVVWSVEDILDVASNKELKIKLNTEMAREVLDELVDDHDASAGITFDVINSKLEDYT